MRATLTIAVFLVCLLGSAFAQSPTIGPVGVAGIVIGTPVSGSCPSGYDLYNNSGVVGCQTDIGSGTVTAVSVASANGVSGVVANPTTTPAITITLGAITPSSAAIGAGSAITSSGAGGALGTGAYATAYTLPAATSSTLGGVKPDGTTITNSSGAISVTYGISSNTAAQGNDTRISGPAAVTGAVKSNGSGTFSQAACADLSNDGTLCPLNVGAGLTSTGGNLVNNAIEHVSFQPGLVTAVTNGKGAFLKFSKASTVDNAEASASSFSCTGNPTVTMYECGTSTTCATPTTISAVTVTAASTVVDGTVSSSAITAGDYVAFAISAGTCISLDVQLTAQVHAN